jgi:hypothetical protein
MNVEKLGLRPRNSQKRHKWNFRGSLSEVISPEVRAAIGFKIFLSPFVDKE